MSNEYHAVGSQIIAETATDLSAAVGKTVNFSAGAPVVSTSATTPITGVVLDARKRVAGDTTYYDNAVGIIPLPFPVLAKISASATAIKLGDELIQSTDGTLINDTSGSRVVVAVCVDPNGASAGDLARVLFRTPVARS